MNIILSPMVAFAIFFGLVYLLYRYSVATPSRRWLKREGKSKVYACGEDYEGFRPQVSYREFFIYAMFYTIIHVTALVLGTLSGGIMAMAIIYIGIISLGLIILIRG